jgi:hypothetical protein
MPHGRENTSGPFGSVLGITRKNVHWHQGHLHAVSRRCCCGAVRCVVDHDAVDRLRVRLNWVGFEYVESRCQRNNIDDAVMALAAGRCLHCSIPKRRIVLVDG